MNETKTESTGIVSNVVVALVFSIVGGLWLAGALFFLTDTIGDYREAHSPEVGFASPWTFRDTLHHVGIGGIFFGFTLPTILLGYGLYLLFSTLGRAMHLSTSKTQ